MTAPTQTPPRPVTLWPFVLAGALTGLVLAVISDLTAPASVSQYAAQALGVALVWAIVIAVARLPLRGRGPRWQRILLAASTIGLATLVVLWVFDRLWGAT